MCIFLCGFPLISTYPVVSRLSGNLVVSFRLASYPHSSMRDFQFFGCNVLLFFLLHLFFRQVARKSIEIMRFQTP